MHSERVKVLVLLQPQFKFFGLVCILNLSKFLFCYPLCLRSWTGCKRHKIVCIMNHNIYGKPKPEFYIIYIRLLDSLCLEFIKKAAYIELIILTFYILTPFSVIFFLYRFKPIATELFRSHLTTYNWTNKFLAK